MGVVCSKNYSGDAKLGVGVWSTYRGKQTCPPACPMFKKCYGKRANANIHFTKAGIDVSKDAETIKAYVTSRPKGDKIRHHVTGDFMLDGVIDSSYVKAVVDSHTARPDLKGWTYTHAWATLPNPSIQSLTVNASCDSVGDIKQAKALGYDTCMVVPKETPKVTKAEGEMIVVCPNQVNKNIKCSDCMMCFRKNRKFTIGFRLH